MFDIKSLAWSTELIFPQLDGKIEDRGEYLCVRTPSNPDYMWGNFLLYREAPRSRSFERWMKQYRSEFPGQAWFTTFGWDSGDDPDCSAFIAKGFKLEESSSFAALSVTAPKRLRKDLEVRAVSEAAEWDFVASRHIQYLCSGPHRAEQEKFERARFASYRRISERGHGHWFIAWAGARAVGDMGIFFLDGKARFQEVLTYPESRRTGVCRSLCYKASRYVFEHHPVKTIVTLSDEADARSAYESIGFRPAGTVRSLRCYDLKLRR